MKWLTGWLSIAVAGSVWAADWGTVSTESSANLNDVEYIDGLFVACGDNGTVLTSSDGLIWTKETVQVYDDSYMEYFGVTSNLRCIGHIYGSLSVIDGNGIYYPRSSGAWNGDAYQTETFPFNDLIDASWMAFAAGSDGNVYLSESDFQSMYSGTSPLYGIASDGGETSMQCAAVGADDTIVYSYDGWSWSQASVSFGGILRDVAFGGYQFAAVGDNGGILITLSDLEYWEMVTSPTTKTLHGVACDGSSEWLAVGADGTLLSSSSDLYAWSEEASPTTETLNAVCYGNGRFVAVGNNGTIVTTGVVNEEPDSTPEVSGLTVSPNPFFEAGSVTLTAMASSTEVLSGAEYFLDAAGADGAGTMISATDGAFDESEEALSVVLDVSGWADDEMHLVYVHAQNSLGEWSDYVQVNVRQGASFVVPRDYATIQAAINAAAAGDVIKVSAGTYNEAVVVNKAVTLQGISADSVFINGLEQNIPLTISGNGGVTLQNITFINGYHYGIRILENADGNVIEDCVIDAVGGADTAGWTSDASYGVWISESDDNRIERTTIRKVNGHLWNSQYYAAAGGIYAENTENTEIRDCAIEQLSGGAVWGIYLFNDYNNTFPGHGHQIVGGSISGLEAKYTMYTTGAYGISCDQTHDLTISDVEITDVSCVSYNGWNPSGGYYVEGIRIDNSKRVQVKGCRFYDLISSGKSGSPHSIRIMGSDTSGTVIGGSADDANAFGVSTGFCVYNDCSGDVDATFNYWPEENPDDRIYDELDYNAYGRVDSSNALQDNAPEITSALQTYAYNGVLYSSDLVAEDGDGDAIVFVAVGLPEGFALIDHGDGSATLSGTPSNDDIGKELWVSVQVVSGPTRQTVSHYFNLKVVENTIILSRPNGAAKVGQSYSYLFSATQHEEFGTLHYAVLNAPDWLQFDAETRILSGTPGSENVGVVAVELSCTDDSGWSVTKSYSLTVLSSAFSYAFWSDGTAIKDVDLQEHYAYAVTLNGLSVIDVSEVSSPAEVAFLAGAGGDNVAVSGTRVAVSYNGVFGIVDVSSPTNPVLLKAYSLGSNIVQLRYADDRVYAITDSTYLYIIDVQDPLNANVLYSGDHGSGAQWSVLDDMDVEGTLLGIVDGYDMGLQLLDVSDPENPVSAGGEFDMWGGSPRIDLEAGRVDMTKQGVYAVYGASSTVSLVGHSDPVELKVVGDCVYVASSAGGLDVIQSNSVVASYSDIDFEINALVADENIVLLATESGLCFLSGYRTESSSNCSLNLMFDLGLQYGPLVVEKTYSTEWCTNLVEGIWRPFVGTAETNGTSCTVTLPDAAPFNSARAVFLRVSEE